MPFFNLSLILFLIMDSLGNIPTILRLTKKTPNYPKLILREMVIALGVMLLFVFLGDYLFEFLQIHEVTVRISSGVILFLTAIRVLFPSLSSLRNIHSEKEPFVTPIAIPLIAGPSLLATIMLFAQLVPNSTMAAAIGAAWALSLLLLLSAKKLHNLLGDNGLQALEKLTGMLMVMLAIQRFLDGITLFLQS